MKLFNKLLLITFLTFLTSFGFAQEKYTLELNSNKYIPEANLETFIQETEIQNGEIVNGKYYRMVQFFELPTLEDQQRITAMGIELLEYYPRLTYLTAFPVDLATRELENLNIRAVFPLDKTLKIDAQLLNQDFPDWAINRDEIKILLKYHKNISSTEAHEAVATAGLRIIKSNGINNFIETRIQSKDLERIAALPFVAHLGFGPAPDVKDDVEGRSLHRSNVLDSGLAMGRNYDGTGVNVLVRDDGQLGPHIDFHGRLIQDLAEPRTEFDTHGDNVGGIMAGAGNFDPTKKGMAGGSGVYVLDYDASFLDSTMFYFFTQDVIITNSSYSNGCNAGYSAITATVDQQVYDNPTLMHVFSAGNSNNNDCGYGAGDQWGNITGGHKQGKNVVAVANLFDDGSLVNSSSRGPAHDGRIKPDIASNGQDQFGTTPNNTYAEFGGTSGAAPGVAGIFAQLQHAYKTLNNEELAPSSLLKAILLNTANDLGNEGPDFRFGWGHVNAFRAVKILEENRYQTLEVGQGSATEFSLNIPDGVNMAKVMLYWDDPEASIGTGFALLNDLDLTLEKDNEVFLPWILDATPDPTILAQPATRGEDHLNNMEQVQIDNPTPGDYTVRINGTVIPFGIKTFHIVYEYQTEAVDITYPIGGETMVPGELQNIHWDALGQLEDYQLSYSIDGGTTWELIASVAGTERLYTNWTVPNVTTGNGKIRITSSNGNEAINEIDFNITPLPQNLAVANACPEGITLSWDAMPDVDSYDVYVLGEKFMEVDGNSIENTYTYVTTNLQAEQYFSVHANFANGAKSRRVNALFFGGGLEECPQENDLSSISTSIEADNFVLTCDGINDEVFTLEITNNGLMPQSDFSVSYQIDNEPAITDVVITEIPAGESYFHDFSEPINLTVEGEYELKSWITLSDNSYAIDDTINQLINLSIYEGDGEGLAYQETFEEPIFPPTDYILVNPDDEFAWEPAFVVQRDGSQGQVASFNNYNHILSEDELIVDGMITTLIDLTNATDEVLAFDLSYVEFQTGGFNGNPDGLRILVSTDCGANFDDVLFEEFGPDLATGVPNTGFFTPTQSSDWTRKLIDVSEYYGESVIFKFDNLSRYGNNIYIDNINVEFVELVAPMAQFTTSIDTICQAGTITFINESESADTYAWTFGTVSNPSSANTAGPHTVTFFGGGVNTIQLITSNAVGVDTFEVEIFVEQFVNATFSSEVEAGSFTVNFTNESNAGSFYNWNFGDGNTSNEENPTHTYAEAGDYTVTLAVGSVACPNGVVSQTVTLSGTTNTNDLAENFAIKLAPNPNNGQFTLRIDADNLETFDWKLTGVDGKTYRTGIINTNLTQEMDVTNLASGIFFLEMTSGNQRLVERVVIMK